MRMSAEKFRGAFEQEWAARIEDSEERERMACAFQRDGSWTKFMLGCNESPNGFLHAVERDWNDVSPGSGTPSTACSTRRSLIL